MKKLSSNLLIDNVTTRRKAKGLTQAELAEATGINRSMIGRLENGEYIPSIEQLQALAEVLGFEVTDLFERVAVTDSPRTWAERAISVAVSLSILWLIETIIPIENNLLMISEALIFIFFARSLIVTDDIISMLFATTAEGSDDFFLFPNCLSSNSSSICS